MPNAPDALLCRYRYDPLDRLAGREDVGQGSGQCFYQNNRLTTEIQGQAQRSWLQIPQQLLAQQRSTADISQAALIGTDIQGSVLHGLDASRPQAYAYSAYGNRHPAFDPLHLPGFNRERVDPITGHYLLGNGYRAFNPLLMRFNSPDSESPFDKGGLNAYAYCAGDPVNRGDPSGHWPSIKNVLQFFGIRRASVTSARASISSISPANDAISAVSASRELGFTLDQSRHATKPTQYVPRFEEHLALQYFKEFDQSYARSSLKDILYGLMETRRFREVNAAHPYARFLDLLDDYHAVAPVKKRLLKSHQVYRGSDDFGRLKYLGYLSDNGQYLYHPDLAKAVIELRKVHGPYYMWSKYGGVSARY